MRKALIVGIDHYTSLGPLSGCVNDAKNIQRLLERHEDGSVNFANPKVLTVSSEQETLTRSQLKESVRELFADDNEIALFYFAGHGHIEETGGYLCASDCRDGDDGLALSEVMTLANRSRSRNKIIILDSCHAGIAGSRVDSQSTSELSDGITILTASTSDQYAYETEGGGAGLFTNLLVDALEGAAANLVGEITPGSVYAHIDQSLGPWGQRPVFKTNIKKFVSLRKISPPVPLKDLRQLAVLFPTEGYEFVLDPAYEPERSAADSHLPAPDPAKNAIFATLQRLVRVNLVRPHDAPHMWHAAIHSKSCRLTYLGEHYRQLVKNQLI